MTDLSEIKGLVENVGNKFNNDAAALKTRLDSLERHVARVQATGVGGFKANGGDNAEIKAAFVQAMRTGRGIEALDEKGMAIGNGPSGGFTVPSEIDRIIQNQLRDVSPIRQIAQVVMTNSSDFKKIVALKGTASGWAGENTARTETAMTELVAVQPSFGELFAYPALTRHLLEDSAFDLEQWLLESVATEFAVREGAAFISGNGVTKPLGFLSFPVGATPNTEADSIRAPGRLQYIATGADGAFGAAPAMADRLIQLVYALRANYRANAVWLMNSITAGAVRSLKDSQGRFLFADSLMIGQPPSLLGHPVVLCEDMPSITTGAFAIAFGDFRAGYLVADRAGLTMVRDEISQPGTIKFYVAKRVGGAMLDSDAIKLLKFSAT